MKVEYQKEMNVFSLKVLYKSQRIGNQGEKSQEEGSQFFFFQKE